MTDEAGNPLAFGKWLWTHSPKGLFALGLWGATVLGVRWVDSPKALRATIDTLRLSVAHTDSVQETEIVALIRDHSMIESTLHVLVVQNCARMTTSERQYVRASNPDFNCP